MQGVLATEAFNLESAVGGGRGRSRLPASRNTTPSMEGVCVFGGAGRGATTRNSYSIPRSCNEDAPHGCGKCRFRLEHEPAMCRQKRAIYLVVWFTQRMSRSIEQNTHEFSSLKIEWSGQLQNLGLKFRRSKHAPLFYENVSMNTHMITGCFIVFQAVSALLFH